MIKKRTLLTTLILLSVMQGSVYAEINEKPVAGKQYDDFLYYDGNGSKDVSLQGSIEGVTQNYYFNEGAMIDSSDGDTHAVILSHNWGSINENTYDIFHIGKDKDFTIKQYTGHGALNVEEKANLHILGGNIVLESGSNYINSGNFDNTISAVHLESYSKLKIDSESLYIGNKRNIEGKYNTGALSINEASQVDIDLKGSFTAENVDFGIAMETWDENLALADIHAGGDITIAAQRSDQESYKGYRGAGIYSMAYYDTSGKSEVNLVSETGNVDIHAQGYGYYGYGNSDAEFIAKNGYINIVSDETHGIYTKGYFDTNTNKTILDAQMVSIQGKTYSIKMDNSKLENTSANFYVSADSYGLYLDNKASATVNSSSVNINTTNGWGICLFDNSLTDVTADNTSINGHIYSKNSDVLIKSDTTNVTGQVKALDGANVDFSSKANSTSGITQVMTNGINAVVATSDTTEQSIVDFNQNTVINAYQMNGDTYVTDYHNNPYERDAIAIQANRNSQVNINTKGNSYALYGDIIAGRGEESNAIGGEINIGGTGTIIRGDILAGNTGKIYINLINGNIEGRIDDYGDAGNGNVFDPKEFDVAVTKSGNIGVTLKDSVWTARHQSWVTSLELDNSLVDLTKDEASSVTIGKLSGSGVFNMRLNSEDHSKGDMLYIGEGSGTHTVNIVGGITGGLENISEDNPLRFATVKNSGGILEVAGSGINAFTKDAGIYDLEYFVTKEDFDKNDEENEVYNGGADGSIVDETGGHKGFKPGNNFVENVLDADGTAENWIITGVKEKKESDTVDTIINMSRANYKNAVYMDRLNKRLGEARYIDGDEGMWVRLRHDRIGMKDEFRSMNTMYQLGYDKLDNKDDKGERHIGAAIDYMDGSTSYSDIYGEGETRRWGFWMYDTWLGSKGHYADYVAKFGHMHNEFDIRSMNTGEKITGDYDNNVFSISAEYGRKKDIGNNWYFEPQAQLQLARVTDAEYKTSQDTDVYVDVINSLIGRAGFRLGKDVDERNTVYIKADILHEFLGDQRITASDVTGSLDKTYENKGTWYDVGFGFATVVGHNSYAYLDFEKSFGNDNDDTYQINAGLQWSF